MLVLITSGGRGKDERPECDRAARTRLFDIRDGKVTRLVVYIDRDRALADLGLEE